VAKKNLENYCGLTRRELSTLLWYWDSKPSTCDPPREVWPEVRALVVKGFLRADTRKGATRHWALTRSGQYWMPKLEAYVRTCCALEGVAYIGQLNAWRTYG
jgi:hypothetical protein